MQTIVIRGEKFNEQELTDLVDFFNLMVVGDNDYQKMSTRYINLVKTMQSKNLIKNENEKTEEIPQA